MKKVRAMGEKIFFTFNKVPAAVRTSSSWGVLIIGFVAAAALILWTGGAEAEDAPSHADLYKMILELKAEQKEIKAEAATLRAEADRHKAEAEAAKEELHKTNNELETARQELEEMKKQARETGEKPVVKAEANETERVDTSTRGSQEGRIGVVGGAEFVYLKPDFSNGAALQVLKTSGTDSLWIQEAYEDDYEPGQRYWLGYQWDSGAGVRARYFNHDQELLDESVESNATTTYFFDGINATGGERMDMESSMEMDVLDLELYDNLEFLTTEMLFGGGVRYGKLTFDYTGAVYDMAGNLLEKTEGINEFEGYGPTVFIDLKRELFNTGLSIFGGLRGSILFGNVRDEERVACVVAPQATTVVRERDDKTATIIGVKLGLQYDFTLWRTLDAFFRATWEAQKWFDVGSPTYSGGDMGLEGFPFGGGFRF